MGFEEAKQAAYGFTIKGKKKNELAFQREGRTKEIICDRDLCIWSSSFPTPQHPEIK